MYISELISYARREAPQGMKNSIDLCPGIATITERSQPRTTRGIL